MGRGTRTLSWFALLWVMLCGLAAAHAQSVSETSVKAVFLARFGSFVDWPARAFVPAGAPLTICVAGGDALADSVAQAAGAGQPGSRMSVRRLNTVKPGSGCNVLYAGGGRSQSVEASLRAVDGEPVLTVTDARNGDTRGMIHFLIVGDRVRFHIDQSEANRSGLRLNARLLNIALTVKSGGPAGGAP